jgi:TolB protein
VVRASRQRVGRPASPAPRRRRPGVLVVAALTVAAAAWLTFLLSQSASPPRVARDGAPSWSPDGRQIVFYSERDGDAEIYVMNADGSDVRRMTDRPSDEGYPSWSPDGREIAFDSDRDGNFEIYVMRADGRDVRRLTNHAARDLSPSWSPDGSRLAFMTNRDGGFEVYVMELSKSLEARAPRERAVQRLTTTGTSWFPVWSPDGSVLAFHVHRDVHLMPAAGGELRRLTTDPANGMYPSWSPDGKRLAFMSWRNGRTEIFTMNADGGDQRVLVSMPEGDAIDPRWSPDGGRIAFVLVPGGMEGEERAICVVNADGSDVRRLSR